MQCFHKIISVLAFTLDVNLTLIVPADQSQTPHMVAGTTLPSTHSPSLPSTAGQQWARRSELFTQSQNSPNFKSAVSE